MRGEFDVFPMDEGAYAPAVNVIGGWLITSWFGGRIDPITGRLGNHGGDDMVDKITFRRPFYAVKPGRVSQGVDPGGGGNWTSLFCDDGDYVGYGHADAFAPSVNGSHVEAGTLLGWIDSTGASTGSHMHFAFNLGGQGAYDDPTDPLRNAADAGRFPGAQQTTNPEGDWFDMATKAEIEEIVRKVVQEEILNQDARIKAVLTSDGEKTRVYLHGDHETTRTYLADKIKQTADAVMETVRTEDDD